MKKLKKLSLKKEEIINLNDYEMNAAKGGSSYVCASISVTSVITSVVYDETKDNSVWACEASNQQNCMSNISERNEWITSVKHCIITDEDDEEVTVYGRA